MSCCSKVKPLPEVTETVELLGSPKPENTSSEDAEVVAVAPLLGVLLLPCACAVRSRGALALSPLYS